MIPAMKSMTHISWEDARAMKELWSAEGYQCCIFLTAAGDYGIRGDKPADTTGNETAAAAGLTEEQGDTNRG